MRRAMVTMGVMTAVGAAGCQAVIGLRDYVVDGSGGAGGGTGGTTMSTGGGGTGGTGGTTMPTGGGGTGGTTLSCTQAGAVFDLFDPTADKPYADRILLLSVPGAQPPRVHAVHIYDIGTGHLGVRTMTAPGTLTPVVVWDTPSGDWGFRQGRIDQSHVSVQGRVTTGNGPTIGEVQFSLDNQQAVQADPAPQLQELPAPGDCGALSTGATLQNVTFAAEGANVHFAATYDDCEMGVRRLYRYTPATGITMLREGPKDTPSLALSNQVRNGEKDMLVFFDGMTTWVSGGTTTSDLQMVTPVALGQPDMNLTFPLAAAPAGATGFVFWWLVPKKGPALPALLYGGTVDGSGVAPVADNASYDVLQTYQSFEAASNWSQPSIGASSVAVAEMAFDYSEIRLSVLGRNGKAILLDQSVEKDAPGAYLDASAAYYGQDTVIVSWIRDDGQTRHYRAQAFLCK